MSGWWCTVYCCLFVPLLYHALRAGLALYPLLTVPYQKLRGLGVSGWGKWAALYLHCTTEGGDAEVSVGVREGRRAGECRYLASGRTSR